MEKNLFKEIEDYEDTESSYHDSNGQSDESVSPETATRPTAEAGNPNAVEVEDDNTSGESKSRSMKFTRVTLLKRWMAKISLWQTLAWKSSPNT
jgi:hypothetical protein